MPEGDSVIDGEKPWRGVYVQAHLPKIYRAKVRGVMTRWSTEAFQATYGTTISKEVCKAMIEHDDRLQIQEAQRSGLEPFQLPTLDQPELPYLYIKEHLAAGRTNPEKIMRIYRNALALVSELEASGVVNKHWRELISMKSWRDY